MLKRWPPGDCIIFHPWRMAAEVKFSIIGRDVEGNLCCDSVCHLASLIKDYHCLLWYPLCLGVHKIQNDYRHLRLMNALWIWGGKHGDFFLCSFCFVIKKCRSEEEMFCSASALRYPPGNWYKVKIMPESLQQRESRQLQTSRVQQFP